MSTQNIYAGFFAKQILGREVMRDYIHGSIRSDFDDLAGEAVGEGIIDPNVAGLGITASADALNDRKLTVTGNLTGLTANGDVMLTLGSSSSVIDVVEGARTIRIHDPAWFVDLPFENANATTYRIYLGLTKYPVDVAIGSGGGRGYGRWVDAPGFSVLAEAVSDQTTHLRLGIDANLTALGMQRWLTSNTAADTWSYDCVVYLDTDVAGVDIATDDSDDAISFFAKMKMAASGTGWIIDLDDGADGYLGQDPAGYDTDPTHYRVVVLGPLITTTDLDANNDWIHVGTDLSGGAETISTAAQIIITSISDLIVNLATVTSDVLSKGWIWRPGYVIAGGGTTVNIAVGGRAFTAGKIFDLASISGSFNGLAINTDLYFAYNPATNAYESFATVDLASAGDLIPAVHAKTDGAGLVTQANSLWPLMDSFPETVTMTLSDFNYHGAFDSLEVMLGFCKFLQDSATIPPKSFKVDVVGSLTASPMAVDELFEVQQIHFSGCKYNKAGSNVKDGSSISWASNTLPLFSMPGNNMVGWTFENIRFRYLGNASTANVAVVEGPSGGGSLNGVSFIGCVFDGISGAGAKGLPSVLHMAEPSTNLLFDGCRFEVTDVPVWSTGVGAGGGITGATIKDCIFDQSLMAVGFTQQGLLVDDGTGSINIKVTSCRYESARGPLIKLAEVVGCYVDKCHVDLQVDSEAIDIGAGAVGGALVGRVWVTNNDLQANVNQTKSMARFASSKNPAAVFVHDNLIESMGTSTSRVGIEVIGTATDGWMVHSNIIGTVEKGIAFTQVGATIDRMVVHSNIVVASSVAIHMGAPSTADYCVIANNVAFGADNAITAQSMNHSVISGNACESSNNVGPVISVIAIDSTIVGNSVFESSAGVTAKGISNTGADSTVVGNTVSTGAGTQGIFSSGASSTVSGNTVSRKTQVNGVSSVYVGNVSGEGGANASISQTIVGNALGADWTPNTATCVVGNNVPGNGFLSITASTLLVGNIADATQHATAAGNACAYIGNIGDIDLSGTGTSVATVVCGNNGHVMNLAGALSSNIAWTGNIVSTSPVIPTVAQANTMTGNIFTPAADQTFDWDNGTIVGNYFQQDLTLAAGSSNIACAANRVNGSVFTDSGTGNSVDGTNDV